MARDIDILRDARDRLTASGRFDGAYIATPSEWHGGGDFNSLAFVHPTGWTERDDFGSSGGTDGLGEPIHTLTFMVTLVVKDADPERRIDRLDLAIQTACNDLAGQSLGALSMPALTVAKRCRYVAYGHPYAGAVVEIEAPCLMGGQSSRDETDDVDDLAP
jgi:hypothetical protein